MPASQPHILRPGLSGVRFCLVVLGQVLSWPHVFVKQHVYMQNLQPYRHEYLYHGFPCDPYDVGSVAQDLDESAYAANPKVFSSIGFFLIISSTKPPRPGDASLHLASLTAPAQRGDYHIMV